MLKRLMSTLVLGLGVAAFGCSHSVDTVEVHGDAQGGGYSWIQTDGHLEKVAAVVGARKTKADDLLKIQIELLNKHDTAKKFYYRIEWIEGDGMIVQSPTPIWQMRTIQGQEQIVLQAVAPNARVTDCKVKLQEDVK